MVRVARHGILDHCVALDCKKGITHDSSSRFLFALTEDIIRRVGGDEETALRVAGLEILLRWQ